LAGYYTSANNRYYYSGVDDWNKKVRTEIASRRNRLAAAQARKKLIARLGSRNDRTVVNTVRDGRPYSYTIVARPGELDRTIAKLEAEIKEWEKKTIDDAWDRRQAFALSGKICRLQVQAIGLLEEIAISSSLSAAEKKKLASYLDDLPLFASRGFLDVPDEIDALVQKDEAVKGLFDQLIGGYENAAADFAFYDRIGRSDVTQNWNNPEFWQAEALAKLTEK
jgi:hypothetical protein